jgi:hypothetical protein
MARKIVWFLAVGILLFTGALGLYNGVTERSGAGTALQKSVTAGVFLYGMLGLAGAAGMIARRRWSVWVIAAWGVTCTYVASVAVIAYAGNDASVVGSLMAGFASALIALAVVWTARSALADQTVAPGR